MYAHRGHIAADRRGHLIDQSGIEGGGPRESRRIDGRAEGGEPGKAFLMNDGRDAKSRRRHQRPLQLANPLHALGRRHGPGPEYPREMADSVLHRLRPRDVPTEHILHRRHLAGHEHQIPATRFPAGPTSRAGSSPRSRHPVGLQDLPRDSARRWSATSSLVMWSSAAGASLAYELENVVGRDTAISSSNSAGRNFAQSRPQGCRRKMARAAHVETYAHVKYNC